MPDNVLLIGRILQKFQLITPPQFEEAVRAHEAVAASDRVAFGDFLRERGHLTPEQCEWLEKAVRHYEAQVAKSGKAPTQGRSAIPKVIVASEPEPQAKAEAATKPVTLEPLGQPTQEAQPETPQVHVPLLEQAQSVQPIQEAPLRPVQSAPPSDVPPPKAQPRSVIRPVPGKAVIGALRIGGERRRPPEPPVRPPKTPDEKPAAPALAPAVVQQPPAPVEPSIPAEPQPLDLVELPQLLPADPAPSEAPVDNVVLEAPEADTSDASVTPTSEEPEEPQGAFLDPKEPVTADVVIPEVSVVGEPEREEPPDIEIPLDVEPESPAHMTLALGEESSGLLLAELDDLQNLHPLPGKEPPAAAMTSPLLPDPLFGMIEAALALSASDLHLHEGRSPRARVLGELIPLSQFQPPSAEDIDTWLSSILSLEEHERLQLEQALIFAHDLPDLCRLRGSVVLWGGRPDLVLRLINSPPNLEELGLPEILRDLPSVPSGLWLCTGPRGSGKSTTLAALLDCCNDERAGRLCTLESPIEFRLKSRRALVQQMEVAAADRKAVLQALLTEDTDVVGISELNDKETASLALSLAESGRLVIAVLPDAADAAAALAEFIGLFPKDEEPLCRKRLAGSLIGVLAQRLVRRADRRGRVVASEILLGTSGLLDLLSEDRVSELRAQAHLALHRQHDSAAGVFLFAESLAELVKKGFVLAEDAEAELRRLPA